MIQGFADSETELIWSGRWETFAFHPVTASRHFGRIVRVSIRSGSMINGVSALYGMKEDLHMSKSSTITSRSGLLLNPHPGEILLEEFLKPMGLSQNALARAVHVAPRRINEIVLGKQH